MFKSNGSFNKHLPTISSLKLTRKRRRQSMNFSKCVICLETESNVKLSKAMRAGQKSVLDAAEIRRDELYHRLLDEFPSFEDVPQILYHRSCFQKYTSKTNMERTKVLPRPETPRESGSQQMCTSSMTTRKSTCSTYWSVCIVCSKRTHRKYKKLPKHLSGTLKEAAYERRDDDMLRNI